MEWSSLVGYSPASIYRSGRPSEWNEANVPGGFYPRYDLTKTLDQYSHFRVTGNGEDNTRVETDLGKRMGNDDAEKKLHTRFQVQVHEEQNHRETDDDRAGYDICSERHGATCHQPQRHELNFWVRLSR